jgi:hypothetical protein
VVLGADAQHGFETAAAEDQQPVETLGTTVRTKRWRKRSLGVHGSGCGSPDVFAAKDLVEGAAEFAVAVVDWCCSSSSLVAAASS